MRVALVYDRVNKIGGAEQVLQVLHSIWPEAPLYTSVYNPRTARWAAEIKVIPSYLNKIPFIRTKHEWLAWAMPTVFESFTFDEFDVVISVTSAEAKGIITKPETLHLCYLLTPTRYLWSHTFFYQQGNYATNKNWLTRKLTPLFFSELRKWDQVAASRPDKIIAISKTVADRVQKYYRRSVDSIIFPPVDGIEHDLPNDLAEKDYYLVVSRLVPYKQIDVAVKAFNQLRKPLVIIGEGEQERYLKQIKGPTIKMLGKVSELELNNYYRNAKALVFPGEEDFGIVTVEAQSAGTPVIAYNRGGSTETVLHKKTGILYDEPSVQSLITAVKTFEQMQFDQKRCIKQAEQFSLDQFRTQFINFVEDAWHQHQTNNR